MKGMAIIVRLIYILFGGVMVIRVGIILLEKITGLYLGWFSFMLGVFWGHICGLLCLKALDEGQNQEKD